MDGSSCGTILCGMLSLATRAATYGWERIGEIIPPLATTTADGGATAAATAEQKGETGGCLVATSTPTKWVLLGHSMGSMAIEAVSCFAVLVFSTFPRQRLSPGMTPRVFDNFILRTYLYYVPREHAKHVVYLPVFVEYFHKS